MSSDRPKAPVSTGPNQREIAAARAKLEQNERRQAHRAAEEQNIARMKAASGAGFFGALAAALWPDRPNVRFVRRSYEAGIIDELRDFYTRPRPWRQKHCRPGATRKERLKLRRRLEQAGEIRRVGRGRFEWTKVGSNA